MTKKEICDKINNSYLSKRAKYNGEIEEVEIKIPIYKLKFKKILIVFLTFFLQRKAYFPDDEHKVSRIDFTKFLKPNDWVIYVENKWDIPLIALPKYVINYTNCWEINLTAKFFKEDLRYGVKPISIFDYLPIYGLGPIILGKKTNKMYSLGSGHWFYHDVIKEYDKFINNKNPAFEWEQLEIKFE